MRRLIFCVAFAVAAMAPTYTAKNERIVAIGDVHGAAEGFAAILTRAGLIDAQQHWSGGSAILVQTGDMTDRGAGTRAALDLLMSLEQQARKAGGRVHALLGNHEVMNLLGELRDATPEIVASFGGEAAMREAFSPYGRYGRWLRSKPAVAQIDDTLFMHAGINLDFTQESIAELNRRVKREIQQWDDGVRWLVEKKLAPPNPPFAAAAAAARAEIERLNAAAAEGKAPEDAPRTAALLLPVANIGSSALFHADGPLWFRGFSAWTDEEGPARVAALLEKYRVKRFVTGHTVQAGGRIRERFNGALVLIDTGMLGGRFFPNGRPSAFEILAATTRSIYLE